MRVVVVGAGLAGLRTVEGLRQRGFTGAITMVGSEAHPPYDRPPLSKQVLRGERPVVFLRAAAAYTDLDLDLRLGVGAAGLDSERSLVTLTDGAEVSYDALVVATGATPRTLPDIGHLDGVHMLRTLEDSASLHDALAAGGDLVVVGGGFIGCEVAASARAMGADVTIVEALPELLVRALGTEVGAAVAALHQRHGVRLSRGIAVSRLDGAGRVERVDLDDGSQLRADTVVVGLGVRPETDWLEGSGVAIDNGVVCDEFCESAVANVFAVGDVARWWHLASQRHVRIEHWTNAVEQAAVVARNIVSPSSDRVAYTPVPYFWSDQYDVKIQALGFPSTDADVSLHTVGPRERLVALYSASGSLTGVVGFSATAAVMKLRPLLATAAPIEEARATLS